MTAARNYLMILVALAAMAALVGCTREITTVEQVDPGPSSCFNCHSDQDPFLVAMTFAWENSWHASGRVVARSTRSSCSPCHSTEGFIQVISGGEPEGFDNPTVIHCFACHQPHSQGDFGLRIDTPTAIQDGTVYDIGAGNICVNCHQGRRDVNTYVSEPTRMSRYFGPHHGPQGDMLYASNAYEYAGYTYEETPFHRTMSEDGCVTCHFAYSNTYAVGGHSFNMRAEDEEEGDVILNLGSCVECHGEGAEDFNLNMVQTEIDSLATELNALLQAAGLMDAENHALSVTTSADSAGAVFNYLYVYEDRSLGVHNAKYARGLLDSSIKFLNGELPPPGK